MLDKIHLKDLISNLDKTIVKLNLEFLRKLIIDASKCNKPWRNKEFAKRIGTKWHKKEFSGTIYGWFSGKRNITFKFLKLIIKLSGYSWNDVENNLISIKAGTTKGWTYPKFPIKIGIELGSVVGHILGDGSIDKRFKQPFYTNQNKELLKEFEINMDKIFGIKPRIWLQKSGNFKKPSKWIKRLDSLEKVSSNTQIGLFYPKICGVILHSTFDKFAYGRGKKKITSRIWNTNNEFKKALIRAFFDDEGSVGLEEIKVFQDNKRVLQDMQKMLIDFNINPNRISWYIKRNKRRYCFTITGYYNFIKFSELISFTSLEKQNKLLNNIKRINERKTFRLRHNETRNYIFLFLQKHKQLTTKEIKLLLKNNFPDFLWDNSTILEHLHNLKKLSLVSHRKVGFRYIWKINNA